MPWPVHPTGFFGARGDSDTYRIERSLRFNSADSAYLSRTFGTPTNQNVWTLSVWLKRSSLNSAGIIGASNGSNNYETIYFDSSSNLLAETWINVPPIQSRNQKTNGIFRDPSSWYHVVVSKNGSWASSYPFTIYINGVSQSLTTFDLNTSFVNRLNTSGVTHQIGTDGLTSNLFNGYMAEFIFIDGQALTPSSFGETDAITGRWKAKAYSGTYGTNGFYLKFADNSGTTSTTLGKDSSGNGNNWTPNNFSVTAGAGNDSLVDSPTNYGSDTGVGGNVRGNYATLNPLTGSTLSVYSNGGLQVSGSGADGGNFSSSYSTIGITSGKWYAEFTFLSGGTNNAILGIGSHVYQRDTSNQNSIINGITSINLNALSVSDRAIIENGVQLTGGDASFSFSLNDIIGIAFDADARTVNFYKNGLILGSTYPYDVASVGNGVFYFIVTTRVNSGTSSFACNFGQRPFAYTAPSGFKALCTQNLPQPTIQKPSTAMDVVTYTGTGASQSISSLGFSPDLVWIKGRSGATDHALYDVIRGSQARLESNTTDAEVTSDNGLTSFNSAGFTVGTLAQVNTNTATYVGWSWDAGSTNSTNTSGSITSTVRANPQAGFSIVSYTGTGANATVGHGLGVAPKMVIVKARNQSGLAYSWVVWHSALSGSEYLVLNLTQAKASASTVWNSAIPTASAVNLGTDAGTNGSAVNYISYCFAEIEGYSKFGSYTGNGSADGPFVWCGFRPRWVLIKTTNQVDVGWIQHDSARNTSNLSASRLRPNTSDAQTSDNGIDILSNGFKMRSADGSTNASGSTFIFAAFAEAPFKYARAR